MAAPLKNDITGDEFGFAEHPEISQQGRNGAWTVSKMIHNPQSLITSDVFGAQAIALISFSPDNHYLAFRTRSAIGSVAMEFDLVVFDIQSGKTIQIYAPEKLATYIGNTEPYIESYEWTGSKLNMVMYTIEYQLNSNVVEHFRVNPKQLWQYDLTSQAYTFVKYLEE